MSGEFLSQKIKDVVKKIKESPDSPFGQKHKDFDEKMAILSNIDTSRKGENVATVLSKSAELNNLFVRKISKLSKKDGEEQLALAEEIESELLDLMGDFSAQHDIASLSKKTPTKEKKSGDYLQLLAVCQLIYDEILAPILDGRVAPDSSSAVMVDDEPNDDSAERINKNEVAEFLNDRVLALDRMLDFHMARRVNFKKEDFRESIKVLVVGKTAGDSEKSDYQPLLEQLDLIDEVMNKIISILDKVLRFNPRVTAADSASGDPLIKSAKDRISEINRLKANLLATEEVSADNGLSEIIENLCSLIEKYLSYVGTKNRRFVDGEDLMDSVDDSLPLFLHDSEETKRLKDLADKIDTNSLKKYKPEKIQELKDELEDAFIRAIPFLSSTSWTGYNQVPDEVIELLKKYDMASAAIEMFLDPGFSSISMRDAAKRVLAEDKDIFKYQDMKNPNTNIPDKLDLLFKRYRVLAGTSVFSDAHMVLGKEYLNQVALNLFKEKEIRVITEDHDGVPVEITNNEKAMNLLLEYFKAAFDRREPEQVFNKMVRELQVFGKSEAEIVEWGTKVYRELSREEEERNYWKVHVQLYYAKKEMEENKSSAVPRSRLYSELTRIIFDRAEMVKASTCHSEYGPHINEMLDYIKSHAAMNNGEVVVERTVVRQTFSADLKPVQERVKVLHKIRVPDGMEWNVFLQKLRDNGEEIRYLRDPKGKDAQGRRVASYEDLSDMSVGGKTLGDEFRTKFPNAPKEARDMAELVFITFVQLDPILGELQSNTKTPAHNGNDKDVDRVSLKDFIRGAVHRMFRYDKIEGRDHASNSLTLFEPLPGAKKIGIYSDEQLAKLGYKDKNKYLTASGRPVDDSMMPFFGKTDGDHGWYASAQIAAKEYLEKFFPTLKTPKIRVRGFLETLGFDTEMFYKLADGPQVSDGKGEQAFNPSVGLIDHSGKVVRKFENIKDLHQRKERDDETQRERVIPSIIDQSKITTWNFYPLAEEIGLLKVLEMAYGPISSGELIDSEKILGKLDDLWSLWGKVKMFPSPVIREAFVTISYEYIMRAVHSCKDIKNPKRMHELFLKIISSLSSNMLKKGGLYSYQKEMATLINLLCEEPIFRLDEQGKAVEIPNAKWERSLAWDDHSTNGMANDRYAITSYVLSLFTTAYRVEDLLENRLFKMIMEERPKALIEGTGLLARNWLKDKVDKFFSLSDPDILLLKSVMNVSSGVTAKPVFDRTGDPLNKPEEDKTKGK